MMLDLPPYHHGPWITTYTGKQFDISDPQPDQIDIEDIAISLSRTVRFRGMTILPYYVAHHCVLATYLLAPEYRLWGLLHDAAEAYMGDMPKPLKTHLDSGYVAIEQRVMRVVAEKFGLEWPMPDQVKLVDRILLVTEAERLMKHNPEDWHMELGVDPDMSLPILPLDSDRAYCEFMLVYHEWK